MCVFVGCLVEMYFMLTSWCTSSRKEKPQIRALQYFINFSLIKPTVWYLIHTFLNIAEKPIICNRLHAFCHLIIDSFMNVYLYISHSSNAYVVFYTVINISLIYKLSEFHIFFLLEYESLFSYILPKHNGKFQ